MMISFVSMGVTKQIGGRGVANQNAEGPLVEAVFLFGEAQRTGRHPADLRHPSPQKRRGAVIRDAKPPVCRVLAKYGRR